LGSFPKKAPKKGILDRKHKELITLGIRACKRPVIAALDSPYVKPPVKLGATDTEMLQVRRVALYVQASPEHHHTELWKAWMDSWREFSLSKGCIDRRCRELVGLGIALVQQDARLIDMHVKAAREFGASPEEIFEVMPIALLMDGAPALSQIPQLVHALEQSELLEVAA
jgi:Uncharacterized homolog of gamma-carboxymuconolactone decarboxylase subunit